MSLWAQKEKKYKLFSYSQENSVKFGNKVKLKEKLCKSGKFVWDFRKSEDNSLPVSASLKELLVSIFHRRK